MNNNDILNESNKISILANIEDIKDTDNSSITESNEQENPENKETLADQNNTTSTNNSDFVETLNDNLEDNMLEEKNNKINNQIDQKTDCLALMVRDSYHALVVKNLFKKSARLSFKVALSVFAINFLNLFL